MEQIEIIDILDESTLTERWDKFIHIMTLTLTFTHQCLASAVGEVLMLALVQISTVLPGKSTQYQRMHHGMNWKNGCSHISKQKIALETICNI